MVIDALAKINWTLDITGKREDGYHMLDMILQTVALHDRITLEEADEITLTLSGISRVPATEDNLALRAAKCISEAANVSRGAAIFLQKTIPVCAGLGGGSADAAAVLQGLNELWGLHISLDKLCGIGLSLGADVPFCLRKGLMRATGIGEILHPLSCTRQLWLVILQPCRGLSTRDVFSAYQPDSIPASAHPNNDDVVEALDHGDLGKLAAAMGNVLQPVACALRPQIHEAIKSLYGKGARAAQMTGSGSAVFGVFSCARDARQAHSSLLKRWPVCILTHTI